MKMFWFLTNKAWQEGYLKGHAFGTYDEQERIIKLLPEIIAMGNICDMLSLEDEMSDLLPDAIALIKGENNG